VTIRNILVAICGVLPLVGTASPAQAPDLGPQVQARLDELYPTSGYPGITVAIVMPDDRTYVAAAGWADRAHTTRVVPTSRMPAGSVGKTFVSAIVLQAVDGGTLTLDDKIARWIGNEPWFGRLPNAAALTLRLLLSHRSGIPDTLESKAFADAISKDLDRRWTPEELIRFALDEKPKSTPGTKYLYTDMNYIVAGLVFEHATGVKLFDAIEQKLLQPLGLDQTVPTQRRILQDVVPGVLGRDEAKMFGHAESLSNGWFVYAAQAEYAGGGLISTSRDLARWAKALYEGRVLSAPRLHEMLTALPSEGKARYGLGVEITSSGAGPVYGHDGSMFGYLTDMIYFPDFKVAAALQINSDLVPGFKLDPGACLGQVASIAIRSLRGGDARRVVGHDEPR
jgi:D-alanyl-D-alanine carboxypeptidase